MRGAEIDALAARMDPYPDSGGEGAHKFYASRREEFAGVMRAYRAQGKVAGVEYLFMTWVVLFRYLLNRTYVLTFTRVLHFQKWSALRRAGVAHALTLPYLWRNWKNYVTHDVTLYEAAVHYTRTL